MDQELLENSQRYLDRLFGQGAGEKHTAFLDRLANEHLREALHRAHVMQADETQLSIEENYLIGMSVLCATRNFGPAAMFSKTLRHLGVPAAKILEAVARLSTWIGAVPAAEAMGHIQPAVKEYDREGLQSLKGWFPEAKGR